jgi:hypothetical protein
MSHFKQQQKKAASRSSTNVCLYIWKRKTNIFSIYNLHSGVFHEQINWPLLIKIKKKLTSFYEFYVKQINNKTKKK